MSDGTTLPADLIQVTPAVQHRLVAAIPLFEQLAQRL
jgi:hypothetical protein